MDISDAPFLDWRVLNDHTQIASKHVVSSRSLSRSGWDGLR